MMWHPADSGLPITPCVSALVTGGTGFLGASLTRRLLFDGVRVRVLARSAANAKPLADLGVEVTLGDITDPATVRAAVDGMQVVYHLAGPLLVPGIPAEEYRRTHVLGTELVLDCCATASGFERLVYCSTTGVLGVTGDRPASEDAPLQPASTYECAKADAETEVGRRARTGFPAVIARPGLVYGPGDTHLLPFFQMIMRRRFRPIGHRNTWLHPIYIEDLTDAMVACGQRRAAIRECFHLAGSEPVTISGLASAIARAEGTRLPPGRIPVCAARAAAGLAGQLPASLRQRVPLTRSRLDFLTHSRVYDVSKASWLLGFAASTDLTAGLTRTVAWYRLHGYLPPDAMPEAGPEKGVLRCESGITY